MSDFLSDQDTRTTHLASNNPFRARAVSPSIPSPTSPFLDPQPAPATASLKRPVSRNPFLDPASDGFSSPPSGDLLINIDDMAAKPAPTTHASHSSIDDIFSSLTVDDKPMSSIRTPSPHAGPTSPPTGSSSGSQAGRPPRPLGPPPSGRPGPGPGPGPGPSRSRGGPMPPRAKNVPPRQSPSSTHRPSHSQEDAPGKSGSGSRPAPGGSGSGEQPDAAGDGPRRPSQTSRPRRNSESSIAPNDKSIPRSERVLRDLRKREQQERGSRSSNRRNDIIDQMDASSIFGNVFHHDGPFDALNPHRNRKGSRRAPMQAFPKDSLNNVIGGSGPLNSRPDHRAFMGQGEEEAFQEFASNRPLPAAGGGPVAGAGAADAKYTSARGVDVFDPLQRGSTLHGDQTLGLGTSTFLEGTPAARTTIQRREAERAQDGQDGGLQRKKSLAQRFRSINRGQRGGGGDHPHPARAFSSDSSGSGHGGMPGGGFAAAASRYNNAEGGSSNRPPMDEWDTQQGEDVLTVRRKNSAALPTPPVPTSPPRSGGLERRSTTDGTSGSSGSAAPAGRGGATSPGGGDYGGDDGQPKAVSGLLARVKSLKGGRRPAPPPPVAKDT